MVSALASVIVVFSSAAFLGNARGGGFGVTPIAITAVVGALSSAPLPTKTEVAGIQWFDSVGDACKTAEEQNKPVLVFQLFGKIDDAFC
jgi:hypothetical protein